VQPSPLVVAAIEAKEAIIKIRNAVCFTEPDLKIKSVNIATTLQLGK
jgi:hypothetical protein